MVASALGGLSGSSLILGHINNHHSHVPFSSHQAVSIVSLEGSNTETVSLVKRSRFTMGLSFPHSFISGVNTLD